MKFAFCVFIAAFMYGTSAVADVANDKLCILTSLNLLTEPPGGAVFPGGAAIRSVRALPPPAEHEVTAPVMSRLVEIIVGIDERDWKYWYICTTQPSQQPVVKLIFWASPEAN
jgi:hypothetical protein